MSPKTEMELWNSIHSEMSLITDISPGIGIESEKITFLFMFIIRFN